MTKKYVLIIEDNKLQAKVFEGAIKHIEQLSVHLKVGETIKPFLNNELKLEGDISINDIGLILLDLNLGYNLSGNDVLEYLTQIKNKTPVFVLSAHSEADIIVKSIKLGALDYFIKGKNIDELKRMYKAIIDIMGK